MLFGQHHHYMMTTLDYTVTTLSTTLSTYLRVLVLTKGHVGSGNGIGHERTTNNLKSLCPSLQSLTMNTKVNIDSAGKVEKWVCTGELYFTKIEGCCPSSISLRDASFTYRRFTDQVSV